MRAWLVEREYDDKGLVRMVYATPDGDRRIVAERSTHLLASTPATAARDVDPERLEPVTDAGTRERYRAEAARMRERHDPNDAV